MPRKLAELTSRDAVLEAIAECDHLGRDTFLKKYGFKYSRLYPLVWKGQRYDSKAIAGVAYGKQHGLPLRAREFSGGIATVLPVLTALGFPVSPAEHPARVLSPGKTYQRKALLELYGGSLQRGIWTPREFPVVFMFTGESGEEYGYRDGWTEDGVFRYTGEGQTGDMGFTVGNTAIRDHRSHGKDLLLFEDLGKGRGVRYVGMFDYATWRKVDGVDRDGRPRKLIVFDLVPVQSGGTEEGLSSETKTSSSVSLGALRAAAYKAASLGAAEGKTGDSKRTWYERSEQVREYVLARAKGVCEACGQPAPFKRRDGTPYLEPHHTRRLADQGPDHPAWVGAICPTCHRRIHSGDDGFAVNEQLQEALRKLEPDDGTTATSSKVGV
jgi:5-methylcytosine-specific restriction protein A